MPCAGHMEGRPNPCPPGGCILKREMPYLENVTQVGLAVSGRFPRLRIIQTNMHNVHTPGATRSALWGYQKVKRSPRDDRTQFLLEAVETDMGRIIPRPPDLLTPLQGLCMLPSHLLITVAVHTELGKGRVVNDLHLTDFY